MVLKDSILLIKRYVADIGATYLFLLFIINNLRNCPNNVIILFKRAFLLCRIDA